MGEYDRTGNGQSSKLRAGLVISMELFFFFFS